MNQAFPHYELKSQKQALLNEMKGALFEFLVAQGLQGGPLDLSQDLITRLETYEAYLRQEDLGLLRKLPDLAQKLLKSLKERGELKGPWKKVDLVGPLFQRDSPHEGDLLLIGEKEQLYVGLKFCRLNSYINTKNAGMGSFLSKYFPSSEAMFYEAEVKESLKNLHAELLRNLYLNLTESHGSEVSEVSSEILQLWREKNLPSLPGQIPASLKPLIHDFYYQMIQLLYHPLKIWFEKNPKLFIQELFPLLGMTRRDLWQAHAYHLGTADYQIVKTEIFHAKDLLLDGENPQISLIPPGKGKSFFLIKGEKFELQIRIKPMNQILARSPKVNCSVKFLLD